MNTISFASLSGVPPLPEFSSFSSPAGNFDVAAFLNVSLASEEPAALENFLAQLRAHEQSTAQIAADSHHADLISSELSRLSAAEFSLRQAAEIFQPEREKFQALEENVRKIKKNTEDFQAKFLYAARVAKYLSIVKDCELLSSSIQAALEDQNPREAAQGLLGLIRIHRSIRANSPEEEDYRVPGLEFHLRHRIFYFLERQRPALIELLRESAKSLGWPQLSAGESSGGKFGSLKVANQAEMENFSSLLEILVSLDLLVWASRCDLPTDGQARKSSEPPKSLWVLEILLEPIERRFKFHFQSSKETGRLDRPEWFLTFLLSAARAHAPFLAEFVQPIVLKCSTAFGAPLDFPQLFLDGLVSIANHRTFSLLPAFLPEPAIFRHFVEEFLTFHSALIKILPSFSSTVNVFTPLLNFPLSLDCWIRIEKDFLNNRLEIIREMKNPMEFADFQRELGEIQSNRIIDDDDEEDQENEEFHGFPSEIPESSVESSNSPYRPTRSSLELVHLLRSITQRYEFVIPLAVRLRFLHEIQLKFLEIYLDDLMEGFAAAFTRFAEALGKSALFPLSAFQSCCGYWNSLEFLCFSILEYSDEEFFLDLYYFQQNPHLFNETTDSRSLFMSSEGNFQSLASAEGGIFEPIVSGMREFADKMRHQLVQAISKDFRSSCSAYRKAGRQFALAALEGEEIQEVSPLFVEPLHKLRTAIMAAKRCLSSALFETLWKKLAESLDSFILRDLIGHSLFSEPGIAQFSRDLEALAGVFHLFSHSSSHGIFPGFSEALAILKSPLQRLRAVKDSLPAMKSLGDRGLREIRGKFGLKKLTIEEIEQFIGRRVEIQQEAEKEREEERQAQREEKARKNRGRDDASEAEESEQEEIQSVSDVSDQENSAEAAEASEEPEVSPEPAEYQKLSEPPAEPIAEPDFNSGWESLDTIQPWGAETEEKEEEAAVSGWESFDLPTESGQAKKEEENPELDFT